MKKILSIIMAMIMMLSSFVVFAEETNEYVIGKESAALLKAFGVADLDVRLSESISRGEFAKYVSIIGGYMIENENYTIADYIESLAKVKIVSSDGDAFEAERQITMQEAVTMLVRVLGYEYLAESIGGYPTGYMSVAKRYGLFDGITDKNAEVTCGIAAQLLENALDTEVLKVTAYADGYTTKENIEGYTLAYRTFGIIHYNDVVNAVDITSLKGENVLPMYNIRCGDILLYYGKDDNPREYLGFDVDVYYTDREVDGEMLIKYIRKTNKNSITEVPIANLSDIKKGKIEYYDGNNKKSVSVSKVAALIYNGAATYEYLDMDSLDEKSGIIRILDNNSDRTGDVIFADVYTDYIVSSIDGTSKRVYDRYDVAKSIVLNITVDDPYTVIYDENGEELGLASIKRGSVLSIYEAYDDAYQKYIEVRVSNAVVEGTVSKITKVSNETVITIGDVQYVLTENCLKYCPELLKPGANVKLLLNNAGYVAGIELKQYDMEYGYIYAIDTGEEGLLSKLKFKIYTVSGNFMIFDTNERLEIDGAIYRDDKNGILKHLNTSAKVVYPSLDDSAYTQPIRYKTDEEGKLTVIDTLCKDKHGTIAKPEDVSGNNAMYRIGNISDSERINGLVYIAAPFDYYYGHFESKFLIGQRTSVMLCPTPSNNDEYLYQMANCYVLASGTVYNAEGYSSGENSLLAEFILLKDSTGMPPALPGDTLQIVSSVYDELVDDEIFTVIEGTAGKFYCKPGFTFTKRTFVHETSKVPDSILVDQTLPDVLSPKDLKNGDVVRIITDYHGYVSYVQFFYRIDSGSGSGKHGIMEINRVHNWSAPDYLEIDKSLRMLSITWNVLRSGYVVRKNNGGFSILRTNDPSKLAGYDEEMLEFNTYSGCNFIIYDTNVADEKNRISSGTAEDLMPYDEIGDDCSRVIIQSHRSAAATVIIIK